MNSKGGGVFLAISRDITSIFLNLSELEYSDGDFKFGRGSPDSFSFICCFGCLDWNLVYCYINVCVVFLLSLFFCKLAFACWRLCIAFEKPGA